MKLRDVLASRRMTADQVALVSGQPSLGRWANGAYFAYDATRDRGFVNYGRSLRPLTGLPGISITRATSAYYTDAQGQLSQFASGAARIGNRGLLVEGSATNLQTYSQAFDNAVWSQASCGIASGVTAPDGTSTAFLMTASSGTGVRPRLDDTSMSSVNATVYTVSRYVKPGTHTFVQFYVNSQGSEWANFTLTGSGTASANGSSTATIQALANGWYRVTCTYTAGGTDRRPLFMMAPSGSATRAETWNPTGTETISVWGHQYEATAYATSYIPTTAGSATRNADVISIGSVTGLAYPVTLFAEFERSADTGANEWLLQIDNNGANERAALRVNTSDQQSSITVSGGAQQSLEAVSGALAIGTVYRGAVRVATNDIKAARGGSLSSGDASATNPAVAPTNIRIGSDNGPANQAFGYLRRLAIFPTAYTDAQLQAITT